MPSSPCCGCADRMRRAAQIPEPGGRAGKTRIRPAIQPVRQRDPEPGPTSRDAVELVLVELWEKMLSVSPVSVTDSFFDLGGHSLMAVTLMSEIHRTFGKR